MNDLDQIKNALTWLIEQQLREHRTGEFLGQRISALIERILAGEKV